MGLVGALEGADAGVFATGPLSIGAFSTACGSFATLRSFRITKSSAAKPLEANPTAVTHATANTRIVEVRTANSPLGLLPPIFSLRAASYTPQARYRFTYPIAN